MCQGEGKCLSQGGGNLGVGSSVDLLFFALIKGKVIKVGPFHDKFKKAKKKKNPFHSSAHRVINGAWKGLLESLCPVLRYFDLLFPENRCFFCTS